MDLVYFIVIALKLIIFILIIMFFVRIIGCIFSQQSRRMVKEHLIKHILWFLVVVLSLAYSIVSLIAVKHRAEQYQSRLTEQSSNQIPCLN